MSPREPIGECRCLVIGLRNPVGLTRFTAEDTMLRPEVGLGPTICWFAV